jgi:NodT family efflux transporter outer membrane factor (OMF) lipoprotein
MVGPGYHRPAAPAPPAWSASPAGGISLRPVEIVAWWTTFDDPLLDTLVERAVAANHDLRIAAARVLEARALRRVSAGDLLPTIDSLASFTNARRSENALTFPVTELDSDLWETGFDARWELDLFGGKRRAFEAATADLEAAVEDHRDVLVTLLAEVARNYVEARGTQRRLAIGRHNIRVQRDAVTLTRERFEAGLTSELDVMQAASLLATTRAEVPVLETTLRRAAHRLAVLVGNEPGALWGELKQNRPIPSPPPEVPVGLPADLLRRRPDIRRSERELAAATARIGVATAELFPKLSLLGLVGLQSLSTGDLFTGGSRFWSAGPSVRWRVFEGGRIRAQIDAEDARQEQALARYEKTVLTALEDTENALVAYAKEHIRYRALAEAVAASRRAHAIAGDLYARGLGDFLAVLDAERSLYDAEDRHVQSESGLSLNLVALYKALGGGWDADTVTSAEMRAGAPARR